MEFYVQEATALFSRFAEKHRLIYDVEPDAPIEVLWTFPVQDGLSIPVTLGLQNGDELNFGVWDFWSYFFPFDRVAADFETYLDAWVEGNARIAITGRSSRLLQVREGDGWKTVYGAGGCLFPFRKRPRGFVQNEAPSS